MCRTIAHTNEDGNWHVQLMSPGAVTLCPRYPPVNASSPHATPPPLLSLHLHLLTTRLSSRLKSFLVGGHVTQQTYPLCTRILGHIQEMLRLLCFVFCNFAVFFMQLSCCGYHAVSHVKATLVLVPETRMKRRQASRRKKKKSASLQTKFGLIQ